MRLQLRAASISARGIWWLHGWTVKCFSVQCQRQQPFLCCPTVLRSMCSTRTSARRQVAHRNSMQQVLCEREVAQVVRRVGEGESEGIRRAGVRAVHICMRQVLWRVPLWSRRGHAQAAGGSLLAVLRSVAALSDSMRSGSGAQHGVSRVLRPCCVRAARPCAFSMGSHRSGWCGGC